MAMFLRLVVPEFAGNYQSYLTGVSWDVRVVADTAMRSSGGNLDPGSWKEIQVHDFVF